MLYRITRHTALTYAHRPRLIESTHTTTILTRRVGDTLYLLEEYVGTTRCLVLSKSPRIPDRVDELVGHWESFGNASAEIKRQGRVS